MNLARPAEFSSPETKYRLRAVVGAMVQQALGKWMEYLGTAEAIDEAFRFAPADASEPFYTDVSLRLFDEIVRP